ncbi:leucyl/phenylalanyl-tRNA--protein transferase, partial [Salmonella enterica]
IRHGGKLIDCQVLNSHTASLGAIEIPRRDYLDHLAALRQQPLASRFWVPRTLFLPRK